jgi:hypothetical protein
MPIFLGKIAKFWKTSQLKRKNKFKNSKNYLFYKDKIKMMNDDT